MPSNQYQYVKALRANRLAADLCRDCGDTPIEGQTRCTICRDKHNSRPSRDPNRKRTTYLIWRNRLSDEVFAAYGGYVCKCCGETTKIFLTIDHINGGGNAHRRQLTPSGSQASGPRFYKWLRDNHYPAGFQVLCMNCNFGRQRNGGRCPHEDAVTSLLVSIC